MATSPVAASEQSPTQNGAASQVLSTNYIEPSCDCGFKVYMDCMEEAYSLDLGRLFVDREKPCPINFSTSVQPPHGTILRVLLVFQKAAYMQDIVTRCPIHIGAANETNAQHVVVCLDQSTEYYTDHAGRHSLTIPYAKPQDGCDYCQYKFYFQCLSTCRGIDKKEMQLIFALENSGKIIGQQVLSIKICANPSRDRKAAEHREADRREAERKEAERKEGVIHSGTKRAKRTTQSETKISPKYVKTEHQSKRYCIWVEDEAMFNILSDIKAVLMNSRYGGQLLATTSSFFGTQSDSIPSLQNQTQPNHILPQPQILPVDHQPSNTPIDGIDNTDSLQGSQPLSPSQDDNPALLDLLQTPHRQDVQQGMDVSSSPQSEFFLPNMVSAIASGHVAMMPTSNGSLPCTTSSRHNSWNQTQPNQPLQSVNHQPDLHMMQSYNAPINNTSYSSPPVDNFLLGPQHFGQPRFYNTNDCYNLSQQPSSLSRGDHFSMPANDVLNMVSPTASVQGRHAMMPSSSCLLTSTAGSQHNSWNQTQPNHTFSQPQLQHHNTNLSDTLNNSELPQMCSNYQSYAHAPQSLQILSHRNTLSNLSNLSPSLYMDQPDGQQAMDESSSQLFQSSLRNMVSRSARVQGGEVASNIDPNYNGLLKLPMQPPMSTNQSYISSFSRCLNKSRSYPPVSLLTKPPDVCVGADKYIRA